MTGYMMPPEHLLTAPCHLRGNTAEGRWPLHQVCEDNSHFSKLQNILCLGYSDGRTEVHMCSLF